MADMTRDPRTDQRPGDVVKLGNKTRTVESVGLCVQGKRRVVYQQVTVKRLSCYGERWDKAVKGAEVIRAAK